MITTDERDSNAGSAPAVPERDHGKERWKSNKCAVRQRISVTPVSRERIYHIVRKIPRGKVATYGQIAVLAGLRGHARQVGYALAALPAGTRVPWHRVINAKGCVSLRVNGHPDVRQRQMLEREGIVFDEKGRVSLARHQWRTRTLHD